MHDSSRLPISVHEALQVQFQLNTDWRGLRPEVHRLRKGFVVYWGFFMFSWCILEVSTWDTKRSPW